MGTFWVFVLFGVGSSGCDSLCFLVDFDGEGFMKLKSSHVMHYGTQSLFEDWILLFDQIQEHIYCLQPLCLFHWVRNVVTLSMRILRVLQRAYILDFVHGMA